jgi:hypothetical protein
MPRSLSQHPDAIRSRERRAAAARAAASHPSTSASVRASPDLVRARRREIASSDRQLARDRVVSDARLTSRVNPIPPANPLVPHRRLLPSARLEDGGYSLNFIASYRPDPIDNSWRDEPCLFCGAHLLSSDTLAWCCNNGRSVLNPLPPFTPGILSLLQSPHLRRLRDISRSLNSLFCLSALGVSEKWTNYMGMYFLLWMFFCASSLSLFHFPLLQAALSGLQCGATRIIVFSQPVMRTNLSIGSFMTLPLY